MSYQKSTVNQILDTYINSANLNSDGPGFVFWAEENGQLIDQREVGKGLSESSVLPIASVSKQFLGAAILSALEAGRSVKDFFPNINMAQTLTVLDLLNQVSGIPEYLYLASKKDLSEWSLEKYCSYILTLPMDGEKRFLYSNSNYVLLSKILEIETGEHYEKYLRNLFFDPLNMKSTFAFTGTVPPNSETTYLWKGKWESAEICRAWMGRWCFVFYIV